MQAVAYVVGPPDGPGAALMDLARRLDFEAVLPYGGVAAAERQARHTPVCFFLFASVPDIESLRPVAEAIRFCPKSRVRFSPLIYFSENPSLECITHCINMGFDDVITRPFTLQRVAGRMERQIGRSLVYYETPGYFGPDRRHRVAAPRRQAESNGAGQFRRLEIVRHLASGVDVLRDDAQMRPAG
jgi:DNA-binding response OmpR family regulator